jgi:putative redox protein
MASLAVFFSRPCAWVSGIGAETSECPPNTATVETGPINAKEKHFMRTATVSTGKGTHRQVVRIGPHTLVADQAVAEGGEDAGPSPHEWILAALGACTSMTTKMYAVRKGWPLASVEVSVAGDHVDGAFVLTRHIAFVGDLTDEQRVRLLDIANRCPVHKSLSGPIRIDTLLVSRVPAE